MKIKFLPLQFCIFMVSSSAIAADFPNEEQIRIFLEANVGKYFPKETQCQLLALADQPRTPHAVPNALLSALIERSSIFGIIVPVTDVGINEIQDSAEAIFTFFYGEEDIQEALRYWNARNRYSAIGFPIQWNERAYGMARNVLLAGVVLGVGSRFLP